MNNDLAVGVQGNVQLEPWPQGEHVVCQGPALFAEDEERFMNGKIVCPKTSGAEKGRSPG